MPWADSILPAASAALSAGILVELWRRRVIGPGSLPDRSLRDPRAVQPVVWLLGALLVYLSQLEGAVIASRLPAAWLGPAKSVQYDAVVSGCGYAAGLVAGLLVLLLARAHAGEKAGLRVRWGDVPRAAIALLLAAPVCLFVGWLSETIARALGAPGVDPLAHVTLKNIIEHRDDRWGWLLAAGAVFGAPVVEEIIYRGFLQSCLLSVLVPGGRGGRAAGGGSGRTGAWSAILVTSAIFAVMHIGAAPVYALPTLFVFSVALGLAYERTRRLGVPIIMHVLFNAGNIAAAMLLPRDAQ